MKPNATAYAVIKTINTVIAVVLVLYCLIFGYLFYCGTIAKMEVPQLGPWRIYVVLSDSMVPAFKTNDAVIVREQNPESLKEGDIIAFRAFEDNATVTHRVIGIEEGESGLIFRTKGDNNPTEDTFETPAENVIGKTITSIPRFGAFIEKMQTNPMLILPPLIAVIVLQLVLNFLENTFKPAKPQKEPAPENPPSESEEPQNNESNAE